MPVRSGPRAFWLSFFLTLAVLAPLLVGFVFYSRLSRGRDGAAPADAAQSGVPILRAGPENDLTVLVAVAASEPGFVLLRLDGAEPAVAVCPLPGESTLLGPEGTVLLKDSYAAAGPARAAELIGGTLNIRIDRYLALTPETLAALWDGLEPPRVNLTGLLDSGELEALGLAGEPVIALEPGEATAFIEGLGLPVARKARLRAAVWQAALRQQLAALPAALPAALRSVSGSLLTDLTAADLYDLTDTLTFLARGDAQVEAEPVPGRYDAASGRYDLAQEAVAFATTRFAPLPAASPAPAAGAAG